MREKALEKCDEELHDERLEVVQNPAVAAVVAEVVRRLSLGHSQMLVGVTEVLGSWLRSCWRQCGRHVEGFDRWSWT